MLLEQPTLVVIAQMLVNGQGQGGVRLDAVVRMQPRLRPDFGLLCSPRFGRHVRAIMLHHVILARESALAARIQTREVLLARVDPMMPRKVPARRKALETSRLITYILALAANAAVAIRVL